MRLPHTLLFASLTVSLANALVQGIGQGFINGAIPGIPALPSASNDNTVDYIVVGAGTAGFTLASRLSESGATVAVIEAGFDEKFSLINGPLSATPGGDVVGVGSDVNDNLNNGIDWNFVTAPQSGANNRKVRYARGKCGGGSSARNFMIYQRPTVGSMKSWQTLTGDDSWGFNERNADFKKSVTFTPPKYNLRQEIPAAQYDVSDFGSSTSAPLSVSYPNTPQNFSKFMQLSANELGVKSIKSFNGGNLLGVNYNSATLESSGGQRSTSRKFYAAANSRSNFKMHFQTFAKKILFQSIKGVPTASAVAISTNLNGSGVTDILYAKKEIIISAGTFQSPQLLMISGVGPKEQLNKFGIIPVAINENVGQGMQDHIFFGPTYPITPATDTFTKLAADPIYLVEQFANFTVHQLGPLTNHVADLLSWERPSDDDLNKIGAGKLSSYPADYPLLEGLSAPGIIGNFANLFSENAQAGLDGKQFATILFALVAPQSRGSITLASDDMATAPIIDPGWLTDRIDQQLAIYAFKRARQYFAANAMKTVLDGPEYLPGATVQSDDQILDWIRDNLMTVWHAACTTSMRTKANGGVLDNKLRVYDVASLRVVDAGSFPNLPPGHPQSTVYMLAERAATLILEND